MREISEAEIQELLKKFKTRFQNYYRDFLKYKENSKPETAARLLSEFDNLFSTKTGYDT